MELKDGLYAQFARVGKALASPRRLELLEVLAQGERSVEPLARAARMSVASASAHLQILREAHLVESRREGTRIHYRLADESVGRLLAALREGAAARLPDLERVARDFLARKASLRPVGRAELEERLRAGDLVVLDARPAEEYGAAHIPGAISVPVDQLEARLAELPADVEIVAYCRGPYCTLAAEAVELLSARGFRARPLEDGLPEWSLAGLPVAVGAGAAA